MKEPVCFVSVFFSVRNVMSTKLINLQEHPKDHQIISFVMSHVHEIFECRTHFVMVNFPNNGWINAQFMLACSWLIVVVKDDPERWDRYSHFIWDNYEFTRKCTDIEKCFLVANNTNNKFFINKQISQCITMLDTFLTIPPQYYLCW